MPICQMKTNYRMSEEQKTFFLQETAKKMAGILEKPLPAVMVMLDEYSMCMNASEDTAFFAEFRYLKEFEDEDEKKVFLKEFADEMLVHFTKYTAVDPYRIYMQFTPMDREGAWRYLP